MLLFAVKYAPMAAVSNVATASIAEGHLRPFNPVQDSAAVADLVELCFADTLDRDGRRYLQGMRTAARAPGFFLLASAAEELSSVPLTGYVWEEDGRIVGNLSLIPYRSGGKRQYLIANVAVHPEYRRRGIGRALTLKGIESARWKGVDSVWLHVREENKAAVNLYHSLGFAERTIRTTWYSTHMYTPAPLPDGVRITTRNSDLWETQASWLGRTYPSIIRWNLPLRSRALRPGIAGAIYRLFTATSVRQWAAWSGDALLGILACQVSLGSSNMLWLATRREQEELAAASLLHHARHTMGKGAAFVLDYPAHHAVESIDSAGFYVRQTLIWMQILFGE